MRRGLRAATTRSKNEGDTGGRRVQMTEMIDGSVDIIKGEDLMITNGSDVGIKETFPELAQAKSTSRSKDGGNIGTGEVGAAIKLERQGMNLGGIKGHIHDIFIREGRRGDVEVEKFPREIDIMGLWGTRLSAGSTKDVNVGRSFRVRNTSRKFIEGNVLGGVDGTRSGVKIENIFKGLGGDGSIMTANARWKGKDVTTKGAKEAKIGLLVGADFVRRLVAIAMNGDVV